LEGFFLINILFRAKPNHFVNTNSNSVTGKPNDQQKIQFTKLVLKGQDYPTPANPRSDSHLKSYCSHSPKLSTSLHQNSKATKPLLLDICEE